MATKATHQGECQLCGRIQKLPGDRLSKHGYTTRWGFFSGVCPGAHHLPFEVSCGLIQAQVDNVKHQIENLQARITQVAAMTDQIFVYVHRAATWERRQSFDEEFLIPVAECTFEHGAFGFQDPKGIAKAIQRAKPDDGGFIELPNGEWGYEITNSARGVNQRKIKKLKAQIKQMEEYVVWQEGRIAKWAPKALTAV